MRRFLILLAALSGLIQVAPPHAKAAALPEDPFTATILAYHRIGEDAYPETNLTLNQFTNHLDAITAGDANVMALPDILDHWQAGTPLPENTIAITFEGAYRSAYENAMLPLIEKKIPFTILYAASNTPHKSNENSEHLDWKTLKSLEKNKNITLGILPAEPTRLSNKDETGIREAIYQSIAKHKDIFKTAPQIFSYPFGEYSALYKSVIVNGGFKAALGLQSGAAHNHSDLFALPRFSMTERFGSLERFHLVTKAMPLPAYDIAPESTTGDASSLTNTIGFSVPEILSPELKNLSCFVSGQEEPHIEILGNRVEIRPKTTISGKTRINCTLPFYKKRETFWRWQGFILNPL
jgi:hypothetical protein